MEPIVIAKIMGHSDIGLIFKVYAEVQEKFKNKEMEKINKYYIDENIGQLNEMKQIENPMFNVEEIMKTNYNIKRLLLYVVVF